MIYRVLFFLRRYAREVVPYGWRNNVILVGVDVLGDPYDVLGDSYDVLGDPFFDVAVRPGGRPLQQYTASEIFHPFQILCIDPFLPFMIK